MKAEKETWSGYTTYRLLTGNHNENVTLENLGDRIRIRQHYDGGICASEEEVNLEDFLAALGLTERSRLPDNYLQTLRKLADAADGWLDWENQPSGEGADELIQAICEYRSLAARGDLE